MDPRNLKRQCADPKGWHKAIRKVKDLRLVSNIIIEKLPNMKLTTNHRLCKQCRGKLEQLATEEEAKHEASTSSDEHTSALSSSDLSAMSIDDSPSYFSMDNELSSLNQSLHAIGESPLKQDRLRIRDKYVEKKLTKVSEKFREKMESVKGTAIKSKKENKSKSELWFEEIMFQLKDKFQTETKRSEKVKILTVLPKSWSIRMIASEFQASTHMAQIAKKLVQDKGIISEPNPKPGKILDSEICNKIKSFYLSEEISRMMPGKKDYVSVLDNGERKQIQKQLVLCNLKEAHHTFKEKYPNIKVGFSKFAELRPRQCILAGAAGTHSVCVCTICQNTKLMFVGSKICSLLENSDALPAGVSIKHPRDLVNLVLCSPAKHECSLRECVKCGDFAIVKNLIQGVFDSNQIDAIEYKRWTQTDRSNLETLKMNMDDFTESFVTQLQSYQRHDFIAKMQASYFQTTKQRLKTGEVLVAMDFAENYSCIIQDEAQSFHWNNLMVTLHPFIIYYPDGHGDENIKHKNFVIISENNNHDTVSVHLYQKHLIAYLKENIPDIKKIIYFSDGCAAQYKSRKNFINLCHHMEDFGIEADSWNFFATSHGKGPCDGLGGTIKRLATKASLQRPFDNQILTPQSLYQFAVDTIKNIDVKYSTIDEYDKEEKFLMKRFSMTKTIAGTQKLHQFKPISKTSLEVKEISNATESRVENVGPSIKMRTPIREINGYATVVYDHFWWLALIKKFLPADEVEISFLHPHGPNASFYFPQRRDELIVSTWDILNEVYPTTSTGRTYHLKKAEQLDATSALAKMGKP